MSKTALRSIYWTHGAILSTYVNNVRTLATWRIDVKRWNLKSSYVIMPPIPNTILLKKYYLVNQKRDSI